MLWNLGQMDGSAEIGVRVFWMGSQKRILEMASVWSDTPFLHMHIISRYHRQQNNSPKGVYLPISKLHSILAEANLLARP